MLFIVVLINYVHRCSAWILIFGERVMAMSITGLPSWTRWKTSRKKRFFWISKLVQRIIRGKRLFFLSRVRRNILGQITSAQRDSGCCGDNISSKIWSVSSLDKKHDKFVIFSISTHNLVLHCTRFACCVRDWDCDQFEFSTNQTLKSKLEKPKD